MKDSIQLDGARISTKVIERCLNAMAEGRPILLIGPMGGGKTMLARRLATLRGGPLRCPHHTVSNAGMMGTNRYPTGGECARANRGTLFLDEMPEFQRATLNAVSLAYQDKQISHYDRKVDTHIGIVTDFYLIASTNACPCGQRGGDRKCQCPPERVKLFRSRTGTFEAAVDFVKIPIKMERDDGSQPVIVLA